MGNQQNTFFKIYVTANRGKPKLSNMGPVSPTILTYNLKTLRQLSVFRDEDWMFC